MTSRPITGELRDAMDVDRTYTMGGDEVSRTYYVGCDEFVRLCDAIDSIHANLERENASLKAELDRLMGEQEEHAHTMGESITGELRKVAAKTECANGRCEKLYRGDLDHIADRIDEEHKKAVRELNDYASDSVLLPRDADGEVIHIGDMMECGKARGHVIALMLSKYPKKWGGELHWGVQLEGEQAPTALDAFFHHYHEPTVEDVLREFGDWYAHVKGGCDEDGIIAEYAAKLRLADDGKEQ